jgi:uncharacterized membrane protein
MNVEVLWSLGDDLPRWGVWVASTVGALGLLEVIYQTRRQRSLRLAVLFTGTAALLLCVMSVLRPARVSSRDSWVGPHVIVLLDQSRRLELPDDSGSSSRRLAARAVLSRLARPSGEVRFTWLGFGSGDPERLPADPGEHGRSVLSDLERALESLGRVEGERAQAVVVISDGRLTHPAGDLEDASLRKLIAGHGIPVHTVRVTDQIPRDASVRSVLATGAAVAHQAFSLRIEVGCEGLACDRLPVHVSELRQGLGPAELARGVAELRDGSATLELEITLDRAGSRVVEVGIEAPPGDRIPDNDRRILTFDVTRERVRLLHIAGRPTYDVRALRRWLKSDQSVDSVAFFILREDQEYPLADDDELALIRFPVDELFTEHLASFDAVMLQDIDAVTYRFAEHLPRLARYVESGGGLILVGGPSAFVGGGYAGSDLERVLPVELNPRLAAFDPGEFVPRVTDAGRLTPVLRAERALSGDEMPVLPGTNLLGPERPGAVVLWEHPRLRTPRGPMPVLALAEVRDGRSIAMGTDGTHLLAFSEIAAKTGGRAYGALWDGLLGWLMRDPRYEGVHVELVRECIAGEATSLRLVGYAQAKSAIEVEVSRLGVMGGVPQHVRVPQSGGEMLTVPVGALEPGGYTAWVRLGTAPPTRFDFACEKAGGAWSDSRPDPARLRRISAVTGGQSVYSDRVEGLRFPKATRVTSERHVTPLLPAWAWTLSAATLLGLHWIVRRRAGLV